jgi:hypothetical protein
LTIGKKPAQIFYQQLTFVIARLDRAIQRKNVDYPVKPDNDSHWNNVRYE